jgi:menaquinone-specific isochorismate synthase
VLNPTSSELSNPLLAAEKASAGQGYISLSFQVSELDPLAVLETLNVSGPRSYFENPALRQAHASGPPLVEWRGRGKSRFIEADAWLRKLNSDIHTLGAPPRVIASFPFYPGEDKNDLESHLFLPTWQVVTDDGVTTVTLCEKATPGCSERLLKQAEQFCGFSYQASPLPVHQRAATVLSEVGGAWFPSAVKRATELIKEGAFEKIVLTRAFDWRKTENFNVFGTLHRLRRANPNCNIFLINEAAASLVGASPETLVALSDSNLKTEAVAGTTRRGESASEDASLAKALLASDKDQREHSAVTASILRRLKMVGVVGASAHPSELLRLGNVMHIRTPVIGKLSADRTFLEVAGELHPTPAVGGKPRDLALPFLPGFEPHTRGLYTGAVGWLQADGKKGNLYVALRCARILDNTARVYAGAGIVAGSDPTLQSVETEMKLKTILDSLI